MELIADVQHLLDIKDKFVEIRKRREQCTIDAFVNEIGPLFVKQTADQTLKDLFHKIDIDAEGHIGWDAFSDFVSTAREQHAGEDTSAEKSATWRLVPARESGGAGGQGGEPSQTSTTPLAGEHIHAEGVEKAIYIPVLDKYISCSRDGTWKVWNASNLLHNKTVRYASSEHSVAPVDRWVIDAVFLPLWRKLAVLCHDSTITFYEVNPNLSSKNFEKILTYPFTEHNQGTPTTLAAAEIHGDEYLLIGMSSGQVLLARPSILDGRPDPLGRQDSALPPLGGTGAMLGGRSFLGARGGEEHAKLTRSHSLAAAVKLLKTLEAEEKREKEIQAQIQRQVEAQEKKEREREKAMQQQRRTSTTGPRASITGPGEGGGGGGGQMRRGSITGHVGGPGGGNARRGSVAASEVRHSVATPDSPPAGREAPAPGRGTSTLGGRQSGVGPAAAAAAAAASLAGGTSRAALGLQGQKSGDAPRKARMSIASNDLNLHSPLRRRFGMHINGEPPPLELLHHHHKDWITKIHYEEETHVLIVTSLDGTISLYDTETLGIKFVYDQHRLGVKGIAYSPSLGVCASYGLEREIHLWLLRSGVKVGSLLGLSGSVVSCAISDEYQQLYSLTVDGQVKVWDLKSQKVLQTLGEDFFERPEDRKVNALMYDSKTRRLLTFYNRPVPWTFKCMSQDTLGHTSPVTVALFNPLFNAIVTCDEGGTVVVWDGGTSRPMNRFENTHDGKGITAATFDNTHRKLFTASNDSRIRVWNFNNGQMLKEYAQSEGPFYHTQLLHAVDERRGIRRLLATGWGGKAYSYEDRPHSSSSAEYKPLEGHREDVLSLAFSPATLTVATGDYEGRIILWSFITLARHRSLHHWLGPSALANAAEAMLYLPPASVYAQRAAMRAVLGQPRGTYHPLSEGDLGVLPSSRSAIGMDPSGATAAAGLDPSAMTLGNPEASAMSAMYSMGDMGPEGSEVMGEGSVSGALGSSSGAAGAAVDGGAGGASAKPSVRRNDSSRMMQAVGPPILISCMGDGRILLWEMRSSARVRAIIRAAHGKFDTIGALALDPDLRYLASGDSVGCVKVWDLQDIYSYMAAPSQAAAEEHLRPLYHFMTEGGDPISSLDLFNDGRELGVANEFVAVTSGATGAAVYTLEGRLVGHLREGSSFNLSDEASWAERHEQAEQRRKRAAAREDDYAPSWGPHDHPIQSCSLDPHGKTGRTQSIVTGNRTHLPAANDRGAGGGAAALGSASNASPKKGGAGAGGARLSAPTAPAPQPQRNSVGQATVLPPDAVAILGLLRKLGAREDMDRDELVEALTLRSESSFLSRLSDSESDLAALLVADGGSISQAVLNLRKVFKTHHGIPMFPGGEEQHGLEGPGVPSGPGGDVTGAGGQNGGAMGGGGQGTWAQDPRTVCLSTLHRSLDCFHPERLPERSTDLLRQLNSTSGRSAVLERVRTRAQELTDMAAAEASLSLAGKLQLPGSPGPGGGRQAREDRRTQLLEKMERILDDSLPPLPTRASHSGGSALKSFKGAASRLKGIRGNTTRSAGVTIHEDMSYAGSDLPPRSGSIIAGLRRSIIAGPSRMNLGGGGGVTRGSSAGVSEVDGLGGGMMGATGGGGSHAGELGPHASRRGVHMGSVGGGVSPTHTYRLPSKAPSVLLGGLNAGGGEGGRPSGGPRAQA